MCGTSATTHTHYISSMPARMAKSESFILLSIQKVSREICRVVVGMWAGGVELGSDNIPTSPSFSCAKLDPRIATTIHQWKERTEGLMAWLDLSVWVKCRPECGYEEICYLPTWPFLDGSDRPPFLGLTLMMRGCSWAVRVTRRNCPFGRHQNVSTTLRFLEFD